MINYLNPKPHLGELYRGILSSTSVAHIYRRLAPSDVERLVDMYHKLSYQTKKYRFHVNLDNITDDLIQKEAGRLANVDYSKDFAAVCQLKQEKDIVGVGRFSLNEDRESAEAAIVVRDDYQRRGIGKTLFLVILVEAFSRKLTYFTASILSENQLFKHFLKSFPLEKKYGYEEGLVLVRIKIPEQYHELLRVIIS